MTNMADCTSSLWQTFLYPSMEEWKQSNSHTTGIPGYKSKAPDCTSL